MRELTRCVAWAAVVCLVAALAALASGVSLPQADGWQAWTQLAVFGPFHFTLRAMESRARDWSDDSLLAASAFGAQFLYFLAVVGFVRWRWRNRRRARR